MTEEGLQVSQTVNTGIGKALCASYHVYKANYDYPSQKSHERCHLNGMLVSITFWYQYAGCGHPIACDDFDTAHL